MIQLNPKVNWGKAQMKRTAWYSGDQKPVHIGCYERNYDGVIAKCYWDNVFFQHQFMACASPRQNLPWRGLVKEITK